MDNNRPAELASWYYKDGLDEAAIARHAGCSRSMVPRYLKEACARSLIEFRIHHPLKTDLQLAKVFQSALPLREAHILAHPVSDSRWLLRRVEEPGAGVLREQLCPDVRLGMGWGTAVYEIVQAMPKLPVNGAQVIQIIGARESGDPMIDGLKLAR
ncbi:MAG: sugar-binding domain-containing protein [Anaerolineae bacterium]|nr:hypothetical protein [Thermoflexus sp.]MDW8064844.1 sugar-binding domain-containing protein [Anaerolineae bacterium]